ncbi:hypothetical protein SAMN05660330_04112 [Desulforhopalus singaporensis]|uniref:Uncharacterized protein n=1 Tax=Desulforhopalus singaporensis TaxID=91360 RepID=A0A1H0VKJ5_9BACT|nr:hypothetical protein SAMN05660330_04112 [Desulforhopalus singaporensis]
MIRKAIETMFVLKPLYYCVVDNELISHIKLFVIACRSGIVCLCQKRIKHCRRT